MNAQVEVSSGWNKTEASRAEGGGEVGGGRICWFF